MKMEESPLTFDDALDYLGRSIPDFDTWLIGPDSAPAASKEFMISEGWIRPND